MKTTTLTSYANGNLSASTSSTPLTELDKEIKYLTVCGDNISFNEVGVILKSLANRADEEDKKSYNFKLKNDRIISIDLDKQDYIITLWNALNAQFKLVEKIGKLIDFKKLFSAWGIPINLIKNKAINAIIIYIVIPIIMGMFTKSIKG